MGSPAADNAQINALGPGIGTTRIPSCRAARTRTSRRRAIACWPAGPPCWCPAAGRPARPAPDRGTLGLGAGSAGRTRGQGRRHRIDGVAPAAGEGERVATLRAQLLATLGTVGRDTAVRAEALAMRIREHREAFACSQEEFAEASGISRATLSKVEQARIYPSMRIRRKLAKALGVGPHACGADPGPAGCGRGGDRPTVTDANLLLGYLNPDNFLGGRVLERSKHQDADRLSVCTVAIGEGDTAPAPGTRSVTSGLPRPNGARRSSSCASRSVRSSAETTASTMVATWRSSSPSSLSACAANASAEPARRSLDRLRHGTPARGRRVDIPQSWGPKPPDPPRGATGPATRARTMFFSLGVMEVDDNTARKLGEIRYVGNPGRQKPDG